MDDDKDGRQSMGSYTLSSQMSRRLRLANNEGFEHRNLVLERPRRLGLWVDPHWGCMLCHGRKYVNSQKYWFTPRKQCFR